MPCVSNRLTLISIWSTLPDSSTQSLPKIPVAPPPNIANPDKEVSVCVCIVIVLCT